MKKISIALNQSEGRLLADLLEAVVLVSEKAKDNIYDRIVFGVSCQLYEKYIGKLRMISPGIAAKLSLPEPQALSLLAALKSLESLVGPVGEDHRLFSEAIISIIHQKTT